MIAFHPTPKPSRIPEAPRTRSGAPLREPMAVLREWIRALDAHEAAEAALAQAMMTDSPELLEVSDRVIATNRRLQSALVVARRLAGS